MERNPVLFRLFVYATFLEGELDHELLAGSQHVGVAKTKAGYKLVELGPLGGIVEGGDSQVVGELYDVDYDTLSACDKKRDHPALYHRADVTLEDGSVAHAYVLHHRQALGLRRVRGGDWRERFAPAKRGEAGPFVQWAKARHWRK